MGKVKKRHPGVQERPGKGGKTTYRIQIRIRGKYYSETFDRKTDAIKEIERIKTEIRDGRLHNTEAKKHTIGDMIDRYILHVLPSKPKSYKKQKAQLVWWKKRIGSTRLSEVTPALLGEQRDYFIQEPIRGSRRSPSTVVRYMAALSHAFTIATKEWGWIDDSPMRKVSKPREPRGRVRFLTDEERKSLLAICRSSANPLLYPVVVLALSTGMRKTETMSLRWSDVDLDRNRLTLHETKNGERRIVPIAGHALELLKELGRVRRLDTNLLFPSKRDPRKPMELRSSWERALKDAGIEDFHFHDLRHTTASYLAMNGANAFEIMEICGWKTHAMAKRYSHLSESHTEKVISRMNEKFIGTE